MRNFAKIAAAASFAVALLAIAAPASANELTFDGNICNVNGASNVACGLENLIDQSYGDTAQVDVQYRYDSTGAATQANSLAFWDNDYSNLTNVAYGTESGNGASIFFAPAVGYSVTLESFDLGGWIPEAPYFWTSLRIFDGNGFVSYRVSPIAVGVGGQSLHIPLFFTSTNGIGISWGPESYNVGIDNVRFTMNRLGGAVPEPATWAMMLIGFGLMGAAMRRNRQTAQVRFAI